MIHVPETELGLYLNTVTAAVDRTVAGYVPAGFAELAFRLERGEAAGEDWLPSYDGVPRVPGRRHGMVRGEVDGLRDAGRSFRRRRLPGIPPWSVRADVPGFSVSDSGRCVCR